VSSEDYCFTAESDRDNVTEIDSNRDGQTTPVASSERADYSLDQTSDGFPRTTAAATNGVEVGSTLVPMIEKTGLLSSKEAFQALREFRESVIAKEIANWEPERSILRDGMIETFIAMKIIDPYDWIRRVPQYQRQNTNPLEKQKYLDLICEIVGRMGEQVI
jgi:hypothetical protein